METLHALQEKIEQLLGLIKDLKAENNRLEKEHKALAKKLNSLEGNEHDLKELSDEKARTKMVVDDLIKSIDSFIRVEKQS
ncbi:MAG: cell division protein ZapB [Candidatus Babeliales bacterium]